MTTGKELLVADAAVRLRRREAGESQDIVYATYDDGTPVPPTMRHHAEDDDCDILAQAYLAEHPADDDEPITGTWLHSIGFTRYMQPASDDGLCIGDWRGGHFPITTKTAGKVRSWWVSGYCLPENCITTRGHVRRLCAAIGVSYSSKR